MKKILIMILAMTSLSLFAQEAPDKLLKILKDNSSSECLIQNNPMELCNCSKLEHRKEDHKCVTAGCCFAETSGTVGDAGTSCEASVQGNYSRAIQEAEDAGVDVGVTSH